MAPALFAIVGTGWRAEFYTRIARALPEQFTLTGVVSRGGSGAFRSVGELLDDHRPDFVVVSVPAHAAPQVVAEIAGREVPVLTETPPAADLAGLRALWGDVGAAGMVQVAEQYMLMPAHAARLSLLRGGAIGEVTSVQVSSTHLYHAVAMIRALLHAGFAPPTVLARAFSAPLADPMTRAGWTGDITPKPAETTLATLDFGGGRHGVYDFTDNQWHNPLRTQRLLVRGSAGELDGDRVVRLADPRSVVESRLTRRDLGIELNLEGLGLDQISCDGEMLYRNPFPQARFADEEIAIATLLVRMAAWTRGAGEPPYPLAEACQDHAIGLAIVEAAATGAPVATAPEPWAS